MQQQAFTSLKEASDFITTLARAQSMLLASVLRALLSAGTLNENDLSDALAATERAALERRTLETPALTGFIDLLRRDLGLS